MQMDSKAAEHEPSPLAPPAPSPMQYGPAIHSSLALTPERPATTVARPQLRRQRRRRAASSASSSPCTEAGLSSASPLCAPPKPLPHALSHPAINSTRRLDRQLREMEKENAPASKTRGESGAVRLPEEALNKVVGVPVSEKVYKDLTSVEVAPSALPCTTHKKVTSRQPTAEEPDVFEFFSPDSLTEEASWEFTLPRRDHTPQFASLGTILQLSRHLWGGHGPTSHSCSGTQ